MNRVMEVLVSNTATQNVISEVVTLLRPDTNYTVNVAALNQFGAGIPATITVRTLPYNISEYNTLFRLHQTLFVCRLISFCTLIM